MAEASLCETRIEVSAELLPLSVVVATEPPQQSMLSSFHPWNPPEMGGIAWVPLRRPWLPGSFYCMYLVKYSPCKGAQIHHSPSVPSVSFKVLLALSLFASLWSQKYGLFTCYQLYQKQEIRKIKSLVRFQNNLSVHRYIEEQIFNHSMCFCLPYLLF